MYIYIYIYYMYIFIHIQIYIYIYIYTYNIYKYIFVYVQNTITVHQLHTKPVSRNAHVILLPMPSHMYQSTTIWTLKHKSASANLAQT